MMISKKKGRGVPFFEHFTTSPRTTAQRQRYINHYTLCTLCFSRRCDEIQEEKRMKKILEDLFFGELQPNVMNHSDNPSIQKCIQIMDEKEETLLKLLEGKERKLLLDLINAQSELGGNCAVEQFINGFTLGARMIAEAIIE